MAGAVGLANESDKATATGSSVSTTTVPEIDTVGALAMLTVPETVWVLIVVTETVLETETVGAFTTFTDCVPVSEAVIEPGMLTLTVTVSSPTMITGTAQAELLESYLPETGIHPVPPGEAVFAFHTLRPILFTTVSRLVVG
jgi:hypothetical protein